MLVLALLIDAFVGEPGAIWRRVPHPVALMGRLVEMLERKFNREREKRYKGMLALLALIAAVWIPAALLSLDRFLGIFEVVGAAILLAQRSLADHVAAVARGLDLSLAEGRRTVAMIVGRDPASLDEPGVARAAIESAAENFSDGVVAPAFWFLIAGLPGIAIYKAVNTADSMIGHRNERYEEFGWAAARLDDLLNWVPARLTGWLICLVGGGWRAVEVMKRDARLHRSPNAGWPEAAMAASLGIALAGPRFYDGARTDDPFLNSVGRREAGPADITRAVDLIWQAWAVLVALAGLLWAFGAALF